MLTTALFLLAASPSSPSSPPPAETPASADEDLFALENELVTAASRTAEPVRTAPASVTVITERELRAFDYENVADAVLGVRGIYETNDRLYQSLGVRGFNRFGDYGNRLQVQMDGHVMNDDWIFSSYVGNDQFSDISHLESIEVVRGPGSALYGTGAFFGVVNLVTPKKAPDYDVRASAGVVDMSTLRLHVDAGHQFAGGPGFWISLGGSTLPPTDYSSPAYIGTPWAADGIAHDANAFTTGTVEAKSWWGDFTLQASFHQRNLRIPTATFGDAFGDLRAEADDRRGFVELRYEPKILDWLQLDSRVYADLQGYSAHYPANIAGADLGVEHYDGAWAGVESRAIMTPFGDDLHITAGAQLEAHPFNEWFGADTPTAAPYIDQSLTYEYVSAYALADWAPAKWFLLNAGLRFDGFNFNTPTAYRDTQSPKASEFLPSLNPRVAAIWLPSDDDTVKLMLGRSFRVPSVYEITYSVIGQLATSTPLRPETIYTGELEYRRRLPLDVLLVASVYENVVTDLLNFITTAEDVEGYQNIAQPLYTTGAEIELRHDLGKGALAAVQYSYQRTLAADVKNPNNPFAGTAVPNSPTHLACAWLITPLGTESFTLANRLFVEDGRLDRNLQPVPPTVDWDVMLTARFDAVPLGFTVGLKNALDWNIEHPVSDRLQDLQLQQDGRTLRFEVNGRW